MNDAKARLEYFPFGDDPDGKYLNISALDGSTYLDVIVADYGGVILHFDGSGHKHIEISPEQIKAITKFFVAQSQLAREDAWSDEPTCPGVSHCGNPDCPTDIHGCACHSRFCEVHS